MILNKDERSEIQPQTDEDGCLSDENTDSESAQAVETAGETPTTEAEPEQAVSDAGDASSREPSSQAEGDGASAASDPESAGPESAGPEIAGDQSTGDESALGASPEDGAAAPEITFDDLGLSDRLVQAVAQAGYTKPTPIQAKAIPVALQGRDILGLAQTGTGKTASFTLPMIDLLAQGRGRARMPRSLILAPTRELAVQVAENFEKYGRYNKLTMALLIGGVSFGEQDQKLDRGVDVLIATPGRLLDHSERGKVLLTGVQVLVFDEADRMLDMGCNPDIERIVKLTPFTRQTLFFSATMPDEIEDLSRRFLQNPVRIEAARPSSTAETVTQAICTVRTEDKREALRRLIRGNPVKNAIIFCNRKRDVTVVFRSLTKHGFNVAALHGDLDQRVRLQVLDQFRKGNIQLLVASDVAARGLDIPDVSHVFNFDVPFNSEDYVHRIGRTGRAGREGHAFMIATRSETKNVAAIEALIEKTIPPMEIEGLGGSSEDENEEDSGRRRGNRRRRGRSEAAAGDETDQASNGRSPRARNRRDKAAREPDQKERTTRESAGEARGDHGSRSDSGRSDGGRSDGGRSDGGRAGGRSATSERRDQASGRGASSSDRRGNRRGDRRRRDEDDDPPVIGLGDHVPAFLLRSVRLPSSSKRTANEDDSKDRSGSSEMESAQA